jgi:hypothetical protein
MKRKILILCILFFTSLAGLSPPPNYLVIQSEPPYSPFKTLSFAIGTVESKNDPMAYNAQEEATGIYQIRPILLKDYNQRTGQSYVLTDCYNPEISNKILLFYFNRFSPCDFESFCKFWNGRGKSNEIYWQRVKSVLDQQ